MKNRSIIIIAVTAAVAVIAVAAVAAVLIVRGGSGSAYQKHLELADRYIEGLEYEQAVAELRAAIEIEPDNSEAYLILSDVYVAMNDHENARAVLQEGYEATGEEIFAERMAELETLRQEYENRQAGAQGNDQQSQPGTETGNASQPEAGTEGTNQEEATPDAEVQLRLQPVFDSLVLFGEPLTAENNWQDICDKLDMENLGEIADEDMLWEMTGTWQYAGDGSGGTSREVTIWTWDDLDVFDYHYSCRTGYTGSSAEDYSGSTESQYLPNGQMYGIQTDVSGAEAGTDYSSLEGFAGYMYEHQITSIADFLRSIGMGAVEPQWITVAEGFFDDTYQDNDIQYYWTEYGSASINEDVYETEYGSVTISFMDWSFLGLESSSVDLFIVFEEEGAPWRSLVVMEYVGRTGVHHISLGAFLEEDPMIIRW